MSDPSLPWGSLLALGAGHGINPAMGWLFAVALGLQRESRGAVWGALAPLALGHAAAIAAAVALAGLAGMVLPLDALRWGTAGLLIGFGGLRLVRTRHPRYGGMAAGARELGVWSFLMASAHGAGLMVLPLVLDDLTGTAPTGHASHAGLILPAAVEWAGLAASVVHTAGYLLATGLIAVVVYEKVGVGFLRKAWLNLDLAWSVALLLTGIATLLG